MFFSFDGPDGVGKSTQIKRFDAQLRSLGHETVVCRDPGSTRLGEAIRGLLLGDEHEEMSLRAEMLLYMAARAQMVDEIIRPALEAGKIVIADRYLLANVVYQGYAGGLDVEELWQVGRTATGGLMPDWTFLLDMPPEAALARLDRQLDRLESRGPDYRARVRAGFLAEAGLQRIPIILIAADGTPNEVAGRILSAASPHLLSRREPRT